MSRRRKNNHAIIILIVLIMILGCILILNKYLSDRKTNDNNKKTKNNSVEKINKKEENETETKKIESKKEDIKEEKKQDTQKSSVDENVENKHEVQRRGGNISIELIGDDEITVTKGSKYVDKGFKATYDDGSDASSVVEVENNVDTNKEGKYTVTYYYGNSVVIRRVIVK